MLRLRFHAHSSLFFPYRRLWNLAQTRCAKILVIVVVVAFRAGDEQGGEPLQFVARGGYFARVDARHGRGPAQFGRVEFLDHDALGRIAFVRGSGRVAVIDERGDVHDATSRFCARPLGLVPAGTGRFAVVCRSGTIGMFGDGQG